MADLSQCTPRPKKLRSCPKQIMYFINTSIYSTRVENNLTCDDQSWICLALHRRKEH